MRGYVYDGPVMDDNGSKELVHLKKEIKFL